MRVMPGQVTAAVKNVMLFPFDSSGATDVDDFVPADPSHFGVSVQVFVGEPDDVDSFDMIVCSPAWFAERAAAREGWSLLASQQHETDTDSVLIGTGLWFMRRWSAAEFRAVLSTVCGAASGGPDWGTVASRIGRAIPWEFDYRYDAHVDERYGEPFPAT
jgi:hypothetical protein